MKQASTERITCLVQLHIPLASDEGDVVVPKYLLLGDLK